jgi:hypothetical protein
VPKQPVMRVNLFDQSREDTRPGWHTLLGPLPRGAITVRQPVAPREVLAGPIGYTLAGWDQLVLHLSAGAAGLRNILVVLDADGTLLSASDAVLYRTAPDGTSLPGNGGPGTMLQLSVGGRFEPDGSFHGTRWHSVAVERGGSEEPEWESTPSQPSPDDVDALRALVEELIRRQPRQPGSPRERR